MLGKLGATGYLLAVLALVFLFEAPAAAQSSQEPPQPGDAGIKLTLSGELYAWHEAPIYARVSGYVKRWYFDYGATVKVGQILADIDAPDLDAQLDAAIAKLDAAKANVNLRQAELQFAKSTYRRWRSAPKGVVSVQGTTAKKEDVKVAAARFDAAVAGLSAAKEEVEHLHAQDGFRHITAPFDGVVSQRNIDIGAPVNADCGSGDRSAPVLFRVADIHKLRIFVKVPEQMSAKMEAGLKATLRLPQFPGKVFNAVVVTSSRVIDFNSQTLLVELNANNPGRVLAPGSSVQVEFNVPKRSTLVSRGRAATTENDKQDQPKNVMVGKALAVTVKTSGRFEPATSIQTR